LRILLEKIPNFPNGDERAGRRLVTAAAMNDVVATRELLGRRASADIPIQAGSGGTPLLIASEGAMSASSSCSSARAPTFASRTKLVIVH
jgi:hypothetical protein